jgi:hypothetical protein
MRDEPGFVIAGAFRIVFQFKAAPPQKQGGSGQIVFEVSMFVGDINEVSFSKTVGSFALKHWVVYLGQAVGQEQRKTRREDGNLRKKTTEAAEFRGKDSSLWPSG